MLIGNTNKITEDWLEANGFKYDATYGVWEMEVDGYEHGFYDYVCFNPSYNFTIAVHRYRNSNSKEETNEFRGNMDSVEALCSAVALCGCNVKLNF